MIEFMGQSGFVWWFGVVEDIDDPLKLGRARVRIFGYHTDDKKAIPTVELPWAHPLQDIGSASISGIGKSPTGLVTGSHVFGFFRDGVNAQQPVIMFSVGGIPTDLADKSKGFNDPNGVYPTEKEIPDTNRLATGDETDKTIVKAKKDGIKKDVVVALDSEDKEKWSEPETPYKTKYPNNKVFATKSGMLEEWDDTPEKERHHTYHPGGSFEEVANGWEKDPPGTRVQKVNGNNYEILAGDDFIHIKGTARITIDGSAKILIGAGEDKGDLNIQVDRDVNLFVKKNLKGNVEGNFNLTVKGDYRETIEGNKYSKIGKNFITEVSGAFGVSGGTSSSPAFIKMGESDLYMFGGNIKLNCKRGDKQNDPAIKAEGSS